MIMIILNGFAIFWPEAVWQITEGWKFKNAEPSDAALLVTRIGGVLGIIFVIVIMTMLPGL